MKIDWDLYKKQADAYLARDVFSGTPLTGEVLAKSAKKTYEETGKYIPVDFALAQAQRESSMGRKGRSPKNNPYNVGEFDEGTKITFKNMEEGVQAYFNLIANDYLVDGKTTDDLMKNFVNHQGNRYATDTEYETYFQQQVPFIQKYLKKQNLDLSFLNPFAASEAYAAEIPGENTMPQTAQDPRQSLTLLQRLLTSPQAEAMFSGMDSVGNFMKNPSEEAGRLARGGVDTVTKTIQENPQQAMELFKQLISSTNPQMGAMISGAGQVGKFAKGFMGDSGQAQAAERKSPYQEGVNKALKSLGEQQAIEAAQSGVPIQQIEQQTQQIVGNDLSSALAGQPQQAQPQQEQQQGQPTDTRDFLTKMFNAIGIKESARNELLRTQAALNRQEIAGEKPLQQGRREELSMEFLNNVMQSSGQKTLSADAVKNLENAKTAVDQSTMLLNEFQNDPDLFKSWGGPGDARGQQVGFVIKNLSDTIGRLRSGGAINDEEMKTFRSFLPKQGFIKGKLEDKQTVMFKLQTINKLFDGIVKGIQPANEAADLANKIQEAIKSGYKPEEITKYLGF